jgi:hypothetical protein
LVLRKKFFAFFPQHPINGNIPTSYNLFPKTGDIYKIV